MNQPPDSRKRPAPRGTAAYSRKRAVAACQTCRSRKTKCDNGRPKCSFCEAAGATCIYSSSDLSAYDPASLAILNRIEQMEAKLMDQMSIQSSQACESTTVSPLSSNLTQLPATETTIVLTESRTPALRNTVEHILSWPVFGDRFENHTDLVQLLRLASPLEQSTRSSFDLDMSTCKQLVERCFEHVLSKNPIIERESLLEVMKSVCLNGIAWDAESCFVLFVCALGSIASADASQCDWAMGRAYFAAAQRRIGMLITCDGVIVSQCYFLAGVYFMYNFRPLEAWRMFAQAVVGTYPSRPEATSQGHYSLDECVYWTSWKSEIELRMNLQVPSFGVFGDRYPPLLPKPPILDTSRDPTWFYYLADISHRRLDMDIRETISAILGRALRPETRYLELAFAVPTLEKQLEDWMASMPISFNLDDPEESVLHFILKGRLHDSYDILYMPFLEGALSMESPSPEVAATLECYARKALEYCVFRLSKKMSQFTILHHGTWLMFRACTRSALLLLAARTAGRMDLLPSGWESALANVVKILQPWTAFAHDLADRLAIIRALSAEANLDLQVEF